MRSHLDPIARPAPPPITARKPPSIPTFAPRKQCRALWSYAAADVDELTFSEDDQVEIVEEVDASWWKGCVVRPDGSRSDAGLFPSNYVEAHPNPITAPPVPARNLLSPPLPARNTPPVYSPTHPVEQQQQPSSYTDEKQMQGLHGQTMAMPSPYSTHENQPAWQQGGGSPWPRSPGPPSNQSYYHQQHDAQAAATQGPSNPALYGTQQPTSTPEEDKKKQDKVRVCLPSSSAPHVLTPGPLPPAAEKVWRSDGADSGHFLCRRCRLWRRQLSLSLRHAYDDHTRARFKRHCTFQCIIGAQRHPPETAG